MIYILLYISIISLITFIIFGIDKYKAQHKQRRISEKNILLLVTLGGGLGALIGMEIFRHKTIKGAFLLKFWAITLVWLIILLISVSKFSL